VLQALAPVDLAALIREAAVERVAATARRFGLPASVLMDWPMPRVSNIGHQHIVSVVRALLAGADLLLLDGVLDELPEARLRQFMVALLAWQHRRGLGPVPDRFGHPKTVVVVSRAPHVRAALRAYCPELNEVDLAAHTTMVAPLALERASDAEAPGVLDVVGCNDGGDSPGRHFHSTLSLTAIA
jgi:hypothetical protein